MNALLDAFIRYLPTAGRGAAGRGRATQDRRAGRRSRRTRPARSSPACSRPPPTRSSGRLTYLRILCGTLHGQAHAWNANRDEDERIGQLLLLHGKEQEPIGELQAGEIGAVAKLDRDRDRRHAVVARARRSSCRRSTSRSRRCRSRSSRRRRPTSTRWAPALQRMLEEEPSARVERSATGEQLLVAMGDAHIAVIGERLKRKFGAAILTKQPKVPYRETIRGKTQVEGKYKKQTGGHGMFGHVWLEIEPNPGGGVEFAERVVGGSVPKGFFPGHREGHPRGGGRGRPRRLSAVRLPGDALRRLVPQRRLERDVVQDRGLDGAQEGRPRLQAGPARADHGRRGHASPRSTWATSTAT